MTEQEIHDICKEYNITNYTINPDGSIDVDDGVDLSGKDLIKIPLKFNKVNGWFDCYKNELTSLEGCPNYIGDYFSCSNNKLTSLENSPKKICGSFNCYDNNLNDLKYAPNRIGDWFGCSVNNLKNLKNSPTCVSLFFCEGNPLESLEGYNNDYDKLECYNKDALIFKTKRKEKLKILNDL